MAQLPERDVDRLVALDARQCLQLLKTRNLGRVAFLMHEEIEIFPVNYACDGRIVVFRTAPGTRLRRSTAARIGFEVDSWEPETGLGWSVVLKGVAREVTSGWDLFSRALRRLDVQPLAPGPRERWIAIFPANISGRRFRTAAPRKAGARAVGSGT